MTKIVELHHRLLPYTGWPAKEQLAWQALIQGGDILDKQGPLAHWADRTQKKFVQNHGYWLRFIAIKIPEVKERRPQDKITRDTVGTYLTDMQSRLSPTTVFMRIVDLLSFAQAVAPSRDWEWLRIIRRKLEARLKPVKDKEPLIVPSVKIFELGLSLMEQADDPDQLVTSGSRVRAQVYRDGLILAMLAARPLRIKNFTALELSRHVVWQGDRYWLYIPAEETKNRRAIEEDLPPHLTGFIDQYLSEHRPALLRDHQCDFLWVSLRATPMSANSIYCAITTQTNKAFGHAINPHLFRDCAATSLALDNPEYVRSAAALLGHKTLSTTQRHYDQSHMLAASRRHQTYISDLRNTLRQDLSGPYKAIE